MMAASLFLCSRRQGDGRMSLGNLEAQFHDEFERAHGSVAVILFFDIGGIEQDDLAIFSTSCCKSSGSVMSLLSAG